MQTAILMFVSLNVLQVPQQVVPLPRFKSYLEGILFFAR